MSDFIEELGLMVEEFGTAPTFEEMPRRDLSAKGINGPTAAHVIEEVHVPLNLAYLTFTTGSTAFQNIVGVTSAELPEKIDAAKNALKACGVLPGSTMLVTYPPLVNVFTNRALSEYPLDWNFLIRSSRDAFLYQLCKNRPEVIVGESTFIRAALEDAKSMGLEQDIPEERIVIVAGTPLDLELIDVAGKYGYKVYDLYGCQEFGWLTLNGIPLRNDISLVPSGVEGAMEFVVGGLPMGDSFVVSESGHVCNRDGKIITYRRDRTDPEYEVWVRETTLASDVTLKRAARTILRIKGRVVKVAPDVKTNSSCTVLELKPGIDSEKMQLEEPLIIKGPDKTVLFDRLVQAQIDLQDNAKNDPIWTKRR
ncbi:MAG TPA: acyl carrier protein [Spirochaetota bacterium]|nr:acyl carrier protein [Spirochaetota bacterium]HPJ34229.1 acyl carrier protein [Spirochaetota bacterium]